MRLSIVPFFLYLIVLGLLGNLWAQGITDRETMIHKNIKLAEMAVSGDIPDNLAKQYRQLLPLFRKVLTQNTKDQPDEKRMLIRVEAGMKEVGSAKTKRALAHVTSSCRNSTKEYVGSQILHGYLTNGPVNEEEIEEFLRKQILEPMQCYVSIPRVFGAPKIDEEPVLVVAEVQPAAAEKPQPTPAPAVAEVRPTSQAQAGPEIEIHRNVYLFDTDAAPALPPELAGMYRRFLPVFKEVLKESTRDHSEENRLIMRVAPGMREVGPAKVKRAQVRVTSVIGDSNKEYITDYSLYSYASKDLVNKDEIAEFLRKQILEPLECYAPAGGNVSPVRTAPKLAPAGRATAAPSVERNPVPVARSGRQSNIHQNVRLIELKEPNDIPTEIADEYRAFLPMFNEVLQKNTIDQPEEKQMTIRVQAGVKEIGSAKTRRALAHVTLSCRNSTRQYVGDLILYSYLTDGPVNEEETEQFLRKQILEPSECYVPTERVFSSAGSN
jgi:hypothetical protein